MLSDLGAWWFEALGAEMRVSRGEEFDGAISTYAFRSWGAGDGAIAIAVLMMCVVSCAVNGKGGSGRLRCFPACRQPGCATGEPVSVRRCWPRKSWLFSIILEFGGGYNKLEGSAAAVSPKTRIGRLLNCDVQDGRRKTLETGSQVSFLLLLFESRWGGVVSRLGLRMANCRSYLDSRFK